MKTIAEKEKMRVKRARKLTPAQKRFSDATKAASKIVKADPKKDFQVQVRLEMAKRR